LYSDESETGVEDEIRGESELQKEAREKEEAEEIKKILKWNWYSLVYILSKGDITKRDEVLKMNFISALNWLAFEKENKSIKELYDKNGNT
jgi:hypothetical protein